MDPNETLEEIRALIRDLDTESSREQYIGIASMLAAHIQDLDEWLSKGGFLPSEWKR